MTMSFWTWILVIVLGVAAAFMAFSLGFPLDERARSGAIAALAFIVAALIIAWMFTWNWGSPL